jgi:hypothetical protein
MMEYTGCPEQRGALIPLQIRTNPQTHFFTDVRALIAHVWAVYCLSFALLY